MQEPDAKFRLARPGDETLQSNRCEVRHLEGHLDHHAGTGTEKALDEAAAGGDFPEPPGSNHALVDETEGAGERKLHEIGQRPRGVHATAPKEVSHC